MHKFRLKEKEAACKECLQAQIESNMHFLHNAQY